MNDSILYIDRATGKKCEEKVYGEAALKLLYGRDLMSKIFGAPLLYLLSKFPLFSACYGWWQKQPWTQKKIAPFIRDFGVDTSEFEQTEFRSFNDFFIRKLKPRVLSDAPAIIPADGRFRCYQNIDEASHFIVKGQKFNLDTLLDAPASDYKTMIIARLCPTDYHRFHFPCDCTPGKTRLLNGPLYSVNPIAIKRNVEIFTQNKRCVTELESPHFGTVQYVEIGATCVGSICQTFTPGRPYKKGDEKGYFSFGASALILLFKHLDLEKDLLDTSLEIRCMMGQALGK